LKPGRSRFTVDRRPRVPDVRGGLDRVIHAHLCDHGGCHDWLLHRLVGQKEEVIDVAETKAAAVSALTEALRRARPDAAVDETGYANQFETNLVEGPSDENVERTRRDLIEGGGHELAGESPKMHAAYSSAMLAVNSFAHWRNSKQDLGLLQLGGTSNFTDLQFERKLATGLRGTPPHLDVLAEGGQNVVAVESKCTEYLGEQVASFKDVYQAKVLELADDSWAAEYTRLVENPTRFRFLNAAQLIKHYLGIKNQLGGLRSVLLYLYWEPSNPEKSAVFAAHRDEIARFSKGLSDANVQFQALSYPELWSNWETLERPPWLPLHLKALRARYSVAV
jgi:hypothetical protein